MKKKLAIIGANTTARVISEFVQFYNLYDIVCFAVDSEYINSTSFCDYPLIAIEDLERYISRENDLLFVAVQWNNLNKDRRRLYEKLKSKGYNFANIISANSIIHSNVILGENIWIADQVVIEPFTTIGNNTFLKTGVFISHFCRIGDHCFISAKSIIAGDCTVGDQTFVGIGATVFDKVSIGEKCLVGARTVVNRNLQAYSMLRINFESQIFTQYDSTEIEKKLKVNKIIR